MSTFSLTQPDTPENGNIRLLLIPIATVLVLIHNYWISTTWNYFSIISLFINAVFMMFILSLLNPLLKKIKTNLALRPSEMLMIYMMLAVATGAGGHATAEMVTQLVGYPFWFATPENEWEDLFYNYLPRWLMVEDKNVLEGFYTANESLYETDVFRAWVRPLLFWSAFLVVLYFAMMCINIVLWRQWMQRERLSFPVVQVPFGLMNPKFPIYKSRIFWYAFGGAAWLSFMNGLHHLYPTIPGPTYGKFELSALFTEKPWNAIGTVYIEFLPFIVGLAFFIPVTLSFSIWFFYWFWKMEMVIGSVTGFHYLPGFPDYRSQGMGAVIFMFIMLIFWARQHLWQVLRTVFLPRKQSRNRSLQRGIGDYAGDAKLYTFAILGIFVSMASLVLFCYYAGMAACGYVRGRVYEGSRARRQVGI